jgi:hypothetical protein
LTSAPRKESAAQAPSAKASLPSAPASLRIDGVLAEIALVAGPLNLVD